MSNIYEVSYKHIEKLNDIQLTKILSKLMYLEANKFGIDKSDVNCSLNITVADGGEDASVQWVDGCAHTDWFKCRNNLFQCKATDMPPSKCKNEIIDIDKDKNIKLKTQVEEVFKQNGAYILFYYKSLSPKQVNERIKAFREALKELNKPYYQNAAIYIYDANKIAAWVNNYLSAIADVLSFNGERLPIILSTWDELSKYEEYSKYKFEADEEILSIIKQLRNHFKDGERNIARIVGLPGLGKTRIAVEVFNDKNIFNKKVVYIDAAYNENEILSLIINARRNEISGTIIIDNCSIELHKKLVREVEHADSKFNILTIDYNLEKITSNYPIIEIKQVSKEIIKKIIKQSYDISEEEINRITEFAQGFPQMAVLISEARLNGEKTIGTLNDSELANKLLWGRDKEDELKLEVIKACSIFEKFGFYEDKDIERDYIAENICDSRINKNIFYKNAKYFIDKGILNRTGRYLSVTPLPLAVRLAAQWWQECIPNNGKKLILSEMPNNMVEFLCIQISKLHFVEEAIELTGELCGSTGPFGQAEVLTTKKGGRIFRALSKVNPKATSISIYNAFKDYSVNELKKISAERREIIWALEGLCFWKDTFDYSSRALLMLAAAENESWSNNATGVLTQLFHAFLSGTEASPKQRLTLVQDALVKSEEEYHILAVKLLGSAIETRGFSRMYGVESQGTRPMGEEWKPKTWGEVFDYWDECLMILSDIAKEQNILGKYAREEIASNFRGLMQYGRIDKLDISLNIIGKELNYNWIEILHSIQDTIKFDSAKMPPEGVDKLKEWLKLFSPKTLKDKLRMIVSLANWDYTEDKEGCFIDISEQKCTELAIECSKRIDDLYNELSNIYTGEQRKGRTFGRVLGELCTEPEKFIAISLKYIVDSEDPNEIVLSGFLSSLRIREPHIVDSTLNTIAKSSELKKFLISITVNIRPNDEDIYRILELSSDKDINISKYRQLAIGRCLDNITTECLTVLCNKLIKHSVEGKIITIEIIYTYINKHIELKDIAANFIFDVDIINNLNKYAHMDDFYFEGILKLLLKDNNGDKYAIKLYKIIRDIVISSDYKWESEKQCEKVMLQLFENYPREIWEILVKDLLTENEEVARRFINLLSLRWLYINDEVSLLELVDQNDIINSINRYGVRLAVSITRIIKKYDCSNGYPRFNGVVRYIIENLGRDNYFLLEKIAFYAGPSSWEGSEIPIYEDKIKALEEYISYKDENINKWARNEIEKINNVIKVIKVREEEQSQGIY